MNPVLRLDHRYHDVEDHDRGLVYDLATLDRRRMLKLLGLGGISAGLFTIVGCNPSGSSATPGATATATAGASQGTRATGSADAASCEVIPEETAGPFPGDGSNGPDVLSQSGVVRKDIRSSFGSSSGVAAGVPLTISLTLQDGADCAPLAGAAVYVWHCDQAGNYSLYSQAAAERELPPRRPGGRRRRRRDVRLDLPGLLPGPLAAHPLRGLSQPRDRERRGEQDRDLPDRAAEGRLRHGLRDLGLRAERPEPGPAQPPVRHGLRRRRRRPSARDDERRRGRRLRGPR